MYLIKNCFLFLIMSLCKLHAVEILYVNDLNKAAVEYVGNTNPENGRMQLELIEREGLKDTDFVLEIGCGALIAGIPIISFLEAGHYVGIDPNKWLIDSSLQIDENKKIIHEKKPIFLFNQSFNATSVTLKFDYILAHSVMSHAPLWQLRLFLENCAKVLKDNGKVLFSLRLTDANPYDGLGKKKESITTEWQYPGNTFFDRSTVIKEASKWFSIIEQKQLYTKLIMETDKGAFHEWFVVTK